MIHSIYGKMFLVSHETALLDEDASTCELPPVVWVSKNVVYRCAPKPKIMIEIPRNVAPRDLPRCASGGFSNRSK